MDKLLKLEGVYDNHPSDKGGETVFGIARKSFSTWAGWVLVDKLKKSTANFPKNLENDDQLDSMVSRFYQMNFWDVLSCDKIEDRELAEKVFFTGVNLGVGTMGKLLQKAVRALSPTGNEGIEVDGIVGGKTLFAIKEIGIAVGYPVLLTKIKELQIEYYKRIVANNPSQKVFLKGWINRANA